MSQSDTLMSMTIVDEGNPSVRIRAYAYAEVVDTHALSWPGWSPNGPHDPTRERRAQPAEFLLPIARRWLESLPPTVQPRALARRFPRLVNRLADAWGDDPSLTLLFDELLIDHRGDRAGFPPPVKADLHRLWRYWHRERAAPTGDTPAG